MRPITQKEAYMANKEIVNDSITVIKELSKKYKFAWKRGNGNIIVITTKNKFEQIKREYKNILYNEYGIMFPEPLIWKKPYYFLG